MIGTPALYPTRLSHAIGMHGTILHMIPACIADSVDWLQVVGKVDEKQSDQEFLNRWIQEIAQCARDSTS
jgi:hypothetical protein